MQAGTEPAMGKALSQKKEISRQHSAISQKKALSIQQSAVGQNKTKTRKRAKPRRRRQRLDDSYRVTTFPEAKGKVVREVRFTHHDPENVLAIAFKDRTVLYFTVDPEPMVLPVDIQAHYIGERRGQGRSWEGLGKDRG